MFPKIVSVINFSGAEWKNYYIFLEKGKYELVFNSDKISYGGKGSLKKRVFTTKKHEDGRYYISIDIPALSGLYLKKLS
jgi:1,4-alpha-glucan branching enzyme